MKTVLSLVLLAALVFAACLAASGWEMWGALGRFGAVAGASVIGVGFAVFLGWLKRRG